MQRGWQLKHGTKQRWHAVVVWTGLRADVRSGGRCHVGHKSVRPLQLPSTQHPQAWVLTLPNDCSSRTYLGDTSYVIGGTPLHHVHCLNMQRAELFGFSCHCRLVRIVAAGSGLSLRWGINALCAGVCGVSGLHFKVDSGRATWRQAQDALKSVLQATKQQI